MDIINDNTNNDLLFPKDKGRGLDLSERPKGFAYGGSAEPFPDNLIIPRSEWQPRIEEKKARKSRLRDIVDQMKLPPKDQEQTNFCWANAPTHCIEILRVKQNQPTVILSPASVACQINGFRNQGGWGKSALQFISDKGATPVDLWPANAIDRKYLTDAGKTAAMNYRDTEWWELEPNNIDHLISALLLGLPVAIGLSWWSHEVTAYDADWIDGAIAVDFRNSWGPGYGDNGYGTLQGRKMSPDDAVCPRLAINS